MNKPEQIPPIVSWIMLKLEDPEYYKHLLQELPRKLANFYSYPPHQLKQKLFLKLLKGCREHGTPELTQEQIDSELQDEYLDLIGWSMVGNYWDEQRRNKDA